MPFSITWEPRGIWRKFTGVVSGDDFLRSQHVMYSDSRYYVSKYAIVDFLDVTDHAITAADIENHLANHIGAAAEHPVRVVAVVTRSPETADQAGRYAAHPLSPQTIRVFSTLDDARAWIAATIEL